MATQTAERATTRNTIQRALVLEAVRSLHNHPTSAENIGSDRDIRYISEMGVKG